MTGARACFLAVVGAALLAYPSLASPAADARSCPAGSDWIPIVPSPDGGLTFATWVAGVVVNALLDTGAPHSAIDDAIARGAGLERGLAEAVTGTGGAATFYRAPPFPAVLGGQELSIGEGRIGDLTTLSPPGIRISLVVGRDLLRNCVVQISFDDRRLRFLQRNAALPRSSPIPITDVGPVATPAVLAHIDGGPAFRSMLDTGSPAGLILIDPHWQQFVPTGARLSSAPYGGIGGIVATNFAIFDRLSVGTAAASDINAFIAAPTIPGGFGVPGQLGLTYLQHFNPVIDLGGHRLWLLPRREAPPPPQRSTSGLVLIPEGQDLAVYHVMRNSPAERAGWKVGEHICAVNGVSAATPEGQRHGWTTGAAGTTLNLQLCDGSHRVMTLADFL